MNETGFQSLDDDHNIKKETKIQKQEMKNSN